MLSSVTLNCQVTMIGVNSGFQLSEMSTISHKFTGRVMCLYLSLSLISSCLFETLIKCLKGHKSPGPLFEGVLYMYLSMSLSLSLSLYLSLSFLVS